MTENIPAPEFEINLLFKDKKNAIDALGQLLKFYNILNEFDKSILRNINPHYVAEYELNGIGYGSVKTRLLQMIRSIPDDLLQNPELKKAIGLFLVKIKYWLIKMLAGDKEIDSREQVQRTTDQVNAALAEIGEQHQLMITGVNNYIILNSVDDLAKEINNLKEKELVEYRSAAGNIFVSKGITINKPKILAELGQRTLVNETTEILKIKKVDLLSDDAKWDFLQGRKILHAKMLDKEWLEQFHHREITIKPEDSVMVTLKTTHTYSPNFDERKTDCEVIKILSIIPPESDLGEQLRIGD